MNVGNNNKAIIKNKCVRQSYAIIFEQDYASAKFKNKS